MNQDMSKKRTRRGLKRCTENQQPRGARGGAPGQNQRNTVKAPSRAKQSVAERWLAVASRVAVRRCNYKMFKVAVAVLYMRLEQRYGTEREYYKIMDEQGCNGGCNGGGRMEGYVEEREMQIEFAEIWAEERYLE